MFYLMIFVAYLLWLRFVMSLVLMNSWDRTMFIKLLLGTRQKNF